MFQPVVDMAKGHVLAFECLARWNSPTLGAVSPATFIPTAERTGLITPITLVMLDKALAAMRTWPPTIKLSFNLSSNDITSQVAVLRIVGLLTKSGVSPSRVIFELTETALLHDFSTALTHIALIKATGAQIALDDFGTGYSSLSHIQNLPLNKLKIDRRFVVDIETNETSRMIVRSLVALCAGDRCRLHRRGGRDRGPGPGARRARLHHRAGLPLRPSRRHRGHSGPLDRFAPAEALSA